MDFSDRCGRSAYGFAAFSQVRLNVKEPETQYLLCGVMWGVKRNVNKIFKIFAFTCPVTHCQLGKIQAFLWSM